MSFGVWELLLVLVVVLLLFGTGKLTRAMGDLARGVRGFRDEMKDAEPEKAQDSKPPEPAQPTRALPAPEARAREQHKEQATQP